MADKTPIRASVTVQQIASGIGRPARQRASLRGLGLKRPGHKQVLADTPQTRGMIAKVAHLVRVLPQAAETGKKAETG